MCFVLMRVSPLDASVPLAVHGSRHASPRRLSGDIYYYLLLLTNLLLIYDSNANI